MKGYAPSGATTPGGTGKTLQTIIGTASKAPRLIGILFGASATPADAVGLFAIKRFTAKGTATAGTAYYNNTGLGLTPDITTENAHSAEPTYVSGPGYEVCVNQRTTFYWQAPEELWAPAGTGSGWGIYFISGPLIAWDFVMDFEQ